MLIHKEKKGTKTSQSSGGFVYYVSPCLKALYHPRHNNVEAIIQRCPILYMYGGIYNQPLSLDYRWLLDHAGGHQNKFTKMQTWYRWRYKIDWSVYGTKEWYN